MSCQIHFICLKSFYIVFPNGFLIIINSLGYFLIAESAAFTFSGDAGKLKILAPQAL